MDIQFFNSKNGQLSCSADGRYLHSSFNPQVEATRFVESVQCMYEPSAVVVTGACLPWCAEPLRKRFPKAKLIAVQFDSCFHEYDDNWDSVFYISNSKQASLFGSELFNSLGEENLMITQFLSWKPSESVWQELCRISWEAIKSCMEKAQAVLTTRNHFNLAWFKHTVHNLSRIKSFAKAQKTDMPILVTASGPSLTKALPFIRDNRASFRLMAASSSLSTLLANDIIPDCCISTDGGYYATRHLRAYSIDSRLENVPLIISGESAVPDTILNHIPCILITYGDGIETVLAEQINVPSVHGLRNGTVSGTAAALASTLTTGPVYMCGLDLAPGKGFQHAEPNENDVPLFTGQSRIRTLETAQASSRYAGGSLTLYREWFATQNESFTNRIFRIVSESDCLEPLGSMKDIQFEKLSLPTANKKKELSFTIHKASESVSDKLKSFLDSAVSFLKEHPEDESCRLWYSSLALENYVLWLRMNSEEREQNLKSLADACIFEIRKIVKTI